jgi:hypothetical protein
VVAKHHTDCIHPCCTPMCMFADVMEKGVHAYTPLQLQTQCSGCLRCEAEQQSPVSWPGSHVAAGLDVGSKSKFSCSCFSCTTTIALCTCATARQSAAEQSLKYAAWQGYYLALQVHLQARCYHSDT